MKIWESFLPVANPKASNRPMPDAQWCAARGIEVESAAILRQIRDEVGAIVDSLDNLEWFSFLIHNRESGVPTTTADDDIYIHLRLKLRKPRRREVIPSIPRLLSFPWQMTRQVELSREIAGVTFDIDMAWALLGEQSAWLLKLLQALPDDPVEMVKNVRQHLHYFANMAQMRVA